MQKKLLAVAVAGALVAPAAFAQTSVTISGVLNLAYESAAASGATNQTAGGAIGYDIRSRDRIQEGNGSNIRFTVVEDLGGGMQAFGQVEQAVFNNAGTQANNAGGAPAAGDGQANGRGWASRNSGIGLRSSAWGEILLGLWDVHYHEHGIADPASAKGMSQQDARTLINNMGLNGVAGGVNVNPTLGGRLSNVIRYASPNWSGFSFRAVYARPTEGTVVNAPGAAGDNGKNRLWSFTPTYAAGPIAVGFSYMNDRDVPLGAMGLWANAAAATAANTTAAGLLRINSTRFFGSYTLPMGFRIGFIYDTSKMDTSGHVAGAASSTFRRSAWVLPLAYTTGPHAVFFSYGKANALRGNIGNAAGVTTDISNATVTPNGGAATTVGNATGARFIQLGYQYDLSKRTNVHLHYAAVRNDSFASYDFFANGVGMTGVTAATQGASYGADPRVFGIGVRHAF